MKKLQKLSLKQLEAEMPVIGSDEQQSFIGGSRIDSNGITWYTQAEMTTLINSGGWGGGFVDGMGYVCEAASASYDGSNTSVMSFYDYLELSRETYGQYIFQTGAQALIEQLNIPELNNAFTVAGIYDDVIEKMQDNNHLDGSQAVVSSGNTEEMLSVTVINGWVVSIYDSNGNLIYQR